MDPRQARIVELRIFAGLSVEIELIVWATSRRRIQDAVNLQSQSYYDDAHSEKLFALAQCGAILPAGPPLIALKPPLRPL
jgi:hypothetical protein